MKYILSILMLLLSVINIYAENKKTDFSLETGVFTAQLWRGFVLNDNTVICPQLDAVYGNLSVAAFSTIETEKQNGLSSDELDLSLDMNHEIGCCSVSLGAIHYGASQIKELSNEVYVSLGINKLIVVPFFAYYRKLESDGENYFSFDLSKSVALKENISLGLGTHLGFSDRILGNYRGGDYSVIADIGFNLLKSVGISLTVSHNVPFGDLADTQKANQPQKTLAGVRIGTSF